MPLQHLKLSLDRLREGTPNRGLTATAAGGALVGGITSAYLPPGSPWWAHMLLTLLPTIVALVAGLVEKSDPPGGSGTGGGSARPSSYDRAVDAAKLQRKYPPRALHRTAATAVVASAVAVLGGGCGGVRGIAPSWSTDGTSTRLELAADLQIDDVPVYVATMARWTPDELEGVGVCTHVRPAGNPLPTSRPVCVEYDAGAARVCVWGIGAGYCADIPEGSGE